jgi:hypothetical protein
MAAALVRDMPHTAAEIGEVLAAAANINSK